LFWRFEEIPKRRSDEVCECNVPALRFGKQYVMFLLSEANGENYGPGLAAFLLECGEGFFGHWGESFRCAWWCIARCSRFVKRYFSG
jgi:hypothetical protein